MLFIYLKIKFLCVLFWRANLMFKLSIFLIAILFAAGLNFENFAQKRYDSKSFRHKSFRSSYQSSNSSKYSKKPTSYYKNPVLKQKSSYYKIKNKYQNKANYRSNTKLNFPSYTRNTASTRLKYNSRPHGSRYNHKK